jgi:hypothetical protein
MTDSCMLDWVEEYLAFRRGLGFDLKSPAWYLRSFARYAKQVGHRGAITPYVSFRCRAPPPSGDYEGIGSMPIASRPFHLAPYGAARDRHAPASVRCGRHGDRNVARS